ncbi:phosphoribosyl 1,2-cyclic phosphate phosphodiesterase [Anaerocolumna jejuensis DSM 15929]|uniref:Phosphoribosyl 1,2-cyclic phosphate phosphodiesterase n=1 Tax=Anaerocolumna jejuensis DSM 15929 TaxID=1121322 RepID=A0A1M6MC50_9FIRM|nr:MBL fold metallo-hydrolase [Anaerocolumna jejuensis]SHJ81056.1 phosphoribosyl 1,2-cyclic phosphate phosphodiesterase [Anaerocolumna jejuensis DSM 15929]
MRLKIIGSGGCVSTPRPLCQCNICIEAREKGFPYARCGCSLYIEDANILIDTPEDIADALNHADIKEVEYLLYSHIDPDHTMGMRVIEQLRLDWLANSIGMKCKNPITVASLPSIIKDIKCQGTKYGSALDYYESMNLIDIQAFTSLDLASIHIDLIPVDETVNVAVFVYTQNSHKVIYAPCDVKPFPENDIFMDADCLIIGNTIVGDVLKDGFVLEKDNPLRGELFVMDEIVELKSKYHIKRVIITHLEEDWGKSYDDYMNLQKQFDGIEFAYDGLEINL